jgi:triphosphatase
MLDDLDPRKRHKLRIAIKKIRYATGYFESLFCAAGKSRKRFEDALKDLQSSLGRLNDIRVHDKLAKDYVHPFPRKQNAPGAAFAMGLINGREQAEEPLLLKAAKRRGRRFERCRPFWR